MKLTTTSVKRPVSITMIYMAIITLSLFALSKLGIDLLPDITFPTITVVTTDYGVGPEEIEKNITERLEEVLGTVNNVKKMKSSSVEGLSIISIEFEWGTVMAEAAADIREKIDLVRDFLPETADTPFTFKFDMSMIPVMVFVIGGASLDQAKTFAEDVVKSELEQIEGVSQARNEGGLEKEIHIEIDRNRLKAYNIPFDHVVRTIGAENINQPAGNIKVGYDDFTIRTEGEYKNLEEIKKVVIGIKGTHTKLPIYLEDIAEVKQGFEDMEIIRTVSQSRAVAVICQKQSGSNTVEIVKKIQKKLESLKPRLPRGMYFKEVFNTGDHIVRSIGNISNSALIAGLLAVLVVMIFLGNMRTTFIIAISIPTSIVVTFLLMYMGGLTLNLMSFGGLALGVGMLVDNSIVVLENIFRHRQMGEDSVNSAIKGAQEVAMPILAGTLTTICVFLPMLFVQGIAGEFFKEMSLTVTFSLLGSLIVALTIIPMLSAKLIKISQVQKLISTEKKSLKFRQIFSLLSKKINQLIEKLEVKYRNSLDWSLRHRLAVLLVTIFLFLSSCFALLPQIQKEFMPEQDRDEIFVDIELKEGTRIEVSEALYLHLAEKIEKVPFVEVFSAKMGTGKDFGSIMQGKTGSHLIVGRINLVKNEIRSMSMQEIREKVRKILEEVPGIKFNFYRPSLAGGTESALQLEIRGKDLNASNDIAKQIQAIMARDYGNQLTDIRISRKEGVEEMVVKINRIKASTMGFNVSYIAKTIRDNFLGATAARYRMKGEELDIVVRLTEKHRMTEKDLENVVLNSPLGFSVPISQVVSIQKIPATVKIERKGQERVVFLEANNAPGVGIGNIVDKLRFTVDQEVVKPAGTNIIYGGSYQDMEESFFDLFLALILASLLIYMIMAAQFESFMNPFIILLSIPLSLVGVIWIVLLTGATLNVITFIGVIILAGIVVNNGIVFVDYIKQCRDVFGMELFEAIIHAGQVRLRPILMTTLTTVIGMIPMAFGGGPGSEMRAPMALAIIGGLSISIFFTLYFTPILYSYFQASVIKRRRRKLNKISA